jgi:hypothetical protein
MIIQKLLTAATPVYDEVSIEKLREQVGLFFCPSLRPPDWKGAQVNEAELLEKWNDALPKPWAMFRGEQRWQMDNDLWETLVRPCLSGNHKDRPTIHDVIATLEKHIKEHGEESLYAKIRLEKKARLARAMRRDSGNDD